MLVQHWRLHGKPDKSEADIFIPYSSNSPKILQETEVASIYFFPILLIAPRRWTKNVKKNASEEQMFI